MKRNRTQQIAADVEKVKESIDDALDRGVTFVYDGKENRMNENEVNQKQFESDARYVDPTVVNPNEPVAPQQMPEPEVEVVTVVDSPEAEANGENQRQEGIEVGEKRADDLRSYTLEELQAMGVPASSIPRNAANTAPDRVSENSEEEKRLAAESPTNSYVVGEDKGQVENNGDEIVG